MEEGHQKLVRQESTTLNGLADVTRGDRPIGALSPLCCAYRLRVPGMIKNSIFLRTNGDDVDQREILHCSLAVIGQFMFLSRFHRL